MESKSQPGTKAEQLEAELLKIDGALRIREQARKAVRDLIRLAGEGDELAVALLAMVAAQTVDALNSVAEQQPRLILPLSRNTPFWPAFIGRKRAVELSNAKLMDMLKLGEGDVYSTRKWQPFAPSTVAAICLFITAQARKQDWGLPPLTKKTKKDWFKASWKNWFKDGPPPEEIPLLAPLGQSAIGKKSTSRGMPHQTERMKRDDVRAEIKRQVWHAFDTVIVGAEK
jgi:hypothetical protein